MTVRPALRFAATVAASVLAVGLVAGCSSAGSKKDAVQQQASAFLNSLSALASGAANAATSAPSNSDTASASDSSSDSESESESTAASPVAAPDGGVRCTDLTNAAATAALGKPATVTLTQTPINLPGLTICDVKLGSEVYPIQLDVDTSNAAVLFAGDKNAFSGTDLPDVGDKAFTSSVGVEVLKGSVDIKVNGPAGAVLSGDYTVATAVAKAMLGVLK